MKPAFLLSLLTLCLTASAQTYQPDWASLDKRPVPQWFTDAKFGIFIHWGVYSVPSYTTKGSYAEWYQNGLERGDSAKKAFHAAKFGNLSYYQLADQFKAELFKPDEWAQLFERSGAKYIVLTSKHHDGFTLWPNQDANRTWGFPWNAMDIGPKRDLLGDLFKAVRKTSVHAGMYYSLYEWFNPLWKSDPEKYAAEHMWPQMKELINTYQPDVFWTDGEWDASEDTWRSKEFLAWMYNESPVKNKVVTYDRWGKGVRFHHGAVYTPEYQPELDFEDHAWEESRGMGYSYGYNREEDAWDYNSAQSLVYHLLDKVSRGGNFLLDIGPDEHGKIPPIMQERLLQIGEWLKTNGEAIYGTTRWKQASQWTAGRRDYKAKKGEDIMMKLTVAPEPGFATKEIFYTYNAQTNSLYAIFPRYPSNRRLVLNNMPATGFGEVTFLATAQTLNSHQEGANRVIDLPEYDPNKIQSPYAYAVRISHYGAFAGKPKIEMTYQPDMSGAKISVSARDPSARLMYQVDNGREKRNLAYSEPVLVTGDAVVSAYVAEQGNHLASDTAQVQVVSLSGFNLMKAAAIKSPQPGIAFRYFESEKMNLAILQSSAPLKEGTTAKVNTNVKQRSEKYGLVFEGYIRVDQTTGYTFYTNSDDGSILFIDGKEIVNNDGNHGAIEKEGRCLLEKGYHSIKIMYFDSGGDNELSLRYQPFGQSKIEVPASVLYH
ncbi:MAG: alpha-L-fucosidase [Sediminibacterium sp.]|nr:alpha-L-fucosidase [Sediminibacterium sp.]